MRKVKQFYRVTMARLSVPQYKILAHHRNIIQFGNNWRLFPRYLKSLQSGRVVPETAQEASRATKNLINLLRDKTGFANLGGKLLFSFLFFEISFFVSKILIYFSLC